MRRGFVLAHATTEWVKCRGMLVYCLSPCGPVPLRANLLVTLDCLGICVSAHRPMVMLGKAANQEQIQPSLTLKPAALFIFGLVFTHCHSDSHACCFTLYILCPGKGVSMLRSISTVMGPARRPVTDSSLPCPVFPESMWPLIIKDHKRGQCGKGHAGPLWNPGSAGLRIAQ